MTRMLKDVGSHTGNEQNMSYEKTDKSRAVGKRGRATDPLGPNSEIGRKLRRYYDELISSEIPDRFNQLLSDLEEKEQPQSLATKD